MSVRRPLAAAVAIVLGVAGVLVGAAAPAQAAALTVTDPGDAGAGTLRQAILDANAAAGPDVISFALPGVAPFAIALATALPDITDSVTITGPGRANLTIDSPATVFAIVGGAPRIDVAISDLTITSTAANACGITATDTSLTVSQVTADDFDCVGINVSDGSLTATDVSVQRSGSGGIGFSGNAATDNLTLTRVNADDAGFKGIDAVLTGGTATVTDVQANDSGFFGISLAGSTGASISLTNAVADDAGLVGIAVQADDSSSATVTDSSTANSQGYGVYLTSNADSTLTATNVTSTGSATSGFFLQSTDAAALTLRSSLAQDSSDSGVWIEKVGNRSSLDLVNVQSLDNDGVSGAGVAVREVSAGSTVTISNSTITGNTSSDDGGGVHIRGVVDDASSVTVSDSTITGNTAADFGGGLYLDGIGGGARSTAKVTIVRTTVDGNTASGYGAGIAISDPAEETNDEPKVLIESSTISNNTTPAGGGGLYLGQSGASAAVVQLLNSTVTGNLAQGGGAVYSEGNQSVQLLLTRSTLAANTAHTSGGVEDNNPASSMIIENSILSGALSDNGSTPNDLATSSAFTVRYSLVQAPAPGVVVAGPGVLTGVSPQLGALANNGGSTKTMLVAPGSPAYDSGDPAFAGAGLVDQRGQARVYQVLDMGAVEWHPELAATGSTLQPEPPLMALLFILSGLAMVAFSRLQAARSVG